MKRSVILTLFVVVVITMLTGSVQIFGQGGLPLGMNRIEGRVTDEQSSGVYNAYVELYNSDGATVARQRTSGSGQYSFKGIGPGRYTVAVKPFGTNLAPDSQDVEIDNSASHSHQVMADFRLRPDRRLIARSENVSIVGTVFAQEVPEPARALYKSGVDAIGSDPEKGAADLEAAVKLFPTYFDALAALGKARIIKGKYEEGYPFLLRAIDVNKRCADCYYSLALAFYKMDKLPAAVMAIEAADALQGNSPAINLLAGMIYRLNKDLAKAEKALLAARSLSKGPNPEVNWQLSMVYNRQNRNKEAVGELEQYLKIKTDMTAAEKAEVNKILEKLRKST